MASDGDIHFPPGQRREKPSFEPPPWERDQFEELARQRREAEPPPSPEVGTDEQPAPKGETAGDEPVSAQPDASEGESGSETPELDPKHVEMLMMGLRSEEPRPQEAYWKISVLAGAASALIGVLVTTWGVVALATPKQPGAGPMLLVTMLLLFGIGFIAGGVWVVVRSLRQQGVL